MYTSKTDLFVVGGGPAGLAAAIAARLKGLEVTVADAAQPSIDKSCGEGLMPDALAALEHLGVSIETGESFAFDGIRFLGGGLTAEASFRETHGIGIRRTRLHQLLVERAAELGVTLLWGAPVTHVTEGMVHLQSAAVQCRWIAGADGENSRVRRWAGLEATRRESSRYGFRRHYGIAPWTTRMEIYWGNGCQMYVTPVSRTEVCVVALSRDSHLRFDAALPQFPALAARLAQGRITERERGAVTASRSLRRVTRGNIFLVGDASGSVDAVSGEGMCLAFRQGIALAETLASDDAASYQLAHERLARRPRAMAGLLLSMDRFPQLRAGVLRALAGNPEIFENMLARHVGALSASGFVFHGILPLGWRLLTA